jgi:phage gpG-like protein
MSVETSFSIDMSSLKGLLEGFDDLARKVARQILEKMKTLTEELQAYIVGFKLHGAVLNRRTGNLARSIKSDVYVDGDSLVGRVFSDGSVPYAAIHEYGGTVNIPDLVPKNVKYLRFEDGTFHRSSRAHPVTIPERSYMRSAMEDSKEWLMKDLSDEYYRVFKGIFGL